MLCETTDRSAEERRLKVLAQAVVSVGEEKHKRYIKKSTEDNS